MRSRLLKKLELAFLVAGAVLIVTYLTVRVHGAVWSRLALIAFQATQDPATARKGNNAGGSSPVDFSFWSTNRIAAYKNLIGARFAPPLAVLSIRRLGLEVPVFDGVDAVTLNRGAGRIPGTARVGGSGNLGIAAHRDGFFRVLKDISIGDTLELQVPDGKETYTVSSIEIVSPENVSVLGPGSRPEVTLVTCYPFYFDGDAPQRFIVHAMESDADFSGGKHTKISAASTRTERQENRK
jgi:sortase A